LSAFAAAGAGALGAAAGALEGAAAAVAGALEDAVSLAEDALLAFSPAEPDVGLAGALE
jgi:hypothetical protein